MAKPPPRGKTERGALIIAAALIAIVLVLYLSFSGGFGTSPTVSEGGADDPATAAPYGVEPTQPMTQPTEQ
jgi:hypothetical protein